MAIVRVPSGQLQSNQKPVWKQILGIKADEEIRTLDPLLGKEMLYH